MSTWGSKMGRGRQVPVNEHDGIFHVQIVVHPKGAGVSGQHETMTRVGSRRMARLRTDEDRIRRGNGSSTSGCLLLLSAACTACSAGLDAPLFGVLLW